MQIVIRQEAGRKHAQIEERLRAVSEKTAPVVEAVTELTLPDQVVLRTVTPRAWRKGSRLRATIMFDRERKELRPSLHSLRMAAGTMKQQRKTSRVIWPVIGAQAVETGPGRTEVQILPSALSHSGRYDDDTLLYKIIAHELTHVAQYEADDGALWAAMNTLFAHQRGTTDRDYGFAIEGHAYWADRQVTAKILGESASTDEISLDSSERYRMVRATVDTESTRLRRGSEAVERIVDRYGVSAFNRIWTSPELIPRTSETGTPDVWQRRFA